MVGIVAQRTARATPKLHYCGHRDCGGTCHSVSTAMYREADCGGYHEWDDTKPVGSRFPLTGESSQSRPQGIYRTMTDLFYVQRDSGAHRRHHGGASTHGARREVAT